MYSEQIDLISFTSISTSDNYMITLVNLFFENIEFSLKGNLLNFNHLMAQPVQLIGSTFTNLTKGRIAINSFNTNSNLKTSVKIIDSLASDIDMQFGSFIYIKTGANLIIQNSNFTTISSLQEGAVLRASFDATTTAISGSTFIENTAIKGSVFFVESQSYVEVSNCIFMYNYANEGGIVASSNDGNFYFSD